MSEIQITECDRENDRHINYQEYLTELEFDLLNDWLEGSGPDDLFIYNKERGVYEHNDHEYGYFDGSHTSYYSYEKRAELAKKGINIYVPDAGPPTPIDF